MIEKKTFGQLSDGRKVSVFTLKNKNGMTATVSDYGAALICLTAADKNENFADVVLGYDSAEGYEKCSAYIGVIAGRYGNRIDKGEFSLDGNDYRLTINNGENHLHGGTVGLSKQIWTTEQSVPGNSQSIKFFISDADGSQGYPGNIELSVAYTLSDENELIIEYRGTTDRPTILNPTNHSYFNLTGDFNNTILDHELMINADSITPVGENLITTGEFMGVENTPFDFRAPIKIGDRIEEDNLQLKYGCGYDHNWVINNWDRTVKKIAEVREPVSGREMEVYTDQPGVQVYTGNFLDGQSKGKQGIVIKRRTGLCLETQCFPDSPNKPHFPQARLNPGEIYSQKTIYKFSVRN